MKRNAEYKHDWMCPPRLLSWTPIPSVTIFGDRAFIEAKVKWGHWGGTLIQEESCPYKRKHQRACQLPALPTHRARVQGEGGHLWVSTPEAGALVWDFWPPVRKRTAVVQVTRSILLWQPELRHNPLQITLYSFTFCPPNANNHCGVFYFICVFCI